MRAFPLFEDRAEAGWALAWALERERGGSIVVVGLARGGVAVAAVVAHALGAELDTVAVRKVRHPLQPEYGLGAVTPGEGLYLRGREDLSDAELARAVEEARRDAVALDAALHAGGRRVEVAGRTLLVVDDGVATGGTLIAALRWARGAGAARVVAAVPVGAPESLARLRGEADDVVCVYAPSPFGAVGAWYGSFEQLHDRDVVRLLRAAVSR